MKLLLVLGEGLAITGGFIQEVAFKWTLEGQVGLVARIGVGEVIWQRAEL